MNRFDGEDITKKTNENGLKDQKLLIQNSVQESANLLRTVNVENNITEDSIIKTIVDKKTGKNKKRLISAMKLTSIITIASLMPGACTSDTILDARNQDLKTYKISDTKIQPDNSFEIEDVIVMDMDKVEEKKLTPTPVQPETISPTPISTPTPTSKEETSEQEPDLTKIDNKDAVIPIQPPVQTEDIKDDKDKTGGGEPIKPANNETQNIENDKNNKNQEKDDIKVDDSKLNNDDNTKDEQVVTPTPKEDNILKMSASEYELKRDKAFDLTIELAAKVTDEMVTELQKYPYYAEPFYDFKFYNTAIGPANGIIEKFYLIEPAVLKPNETFLSNWHLVYETRNNLFVVRGVLQEKLEDGTIKESYVEFIYKSGKYVSEYGDTTYVLVEKKILK